MFIDEAKITVKAGDGGDGAVSFRRERYVPKGGPDGGDGGDGGDVIILATRHASDLSIFNRLRHFEAERGADGMGKKKHGKFGEHIILRVPLGTQIKENGELIADMVKDEQKLVIAKGGSGGWGNHHFATSIKQTPEWSKEGLKGESKELFFELKTIADVGIIGLPNAGKSSLLATISNAKPKIANYPFTTLEPNLGAIKEKGRTLILADIPGLIEGASKGRGLGDKFLKHIERTKILLHLVDASSDDVVRDYAIIRSELKDFSTKLLKKKEIVVLNKVDIVPEKELKIKIKAFKKAKVTPLLISTATKSGVKDLINQISKELK